MKNSSLAEGNNVVSYRENISAVRDNMSKGRLHH